MSEDSIHWRAPDPTRPARAIFFSRSGRLSRGWRVFSSRFDAILLDLRAVDELTEAALEGFCRTSWPTARAASSPSVPCRIIRSFRAPPPPLPPRQFKQPLSQPRGPVSSNSKPTRSSTPSPQGLLFQPPGLAAPSHQPGWTGELKRGARAPLGSFRPEGAVDVLALHTFGGGRAIWFGLLTILALALGKRPADSSNTAFFWTESLLWLSSGARPRVRAELQGSRVTADAPRGPRPTSARARLPAPNGEARVVAVAPPAPMAAAKKSFLQPDAFEVRAFPCARAQATGAGVHQVDYRMEFTDAEVLETDVQFFRCARRSGGSFSTPVSREGPLRDLARLPGGRYFTLAEAREIVLTCPLPKRSPSSRKNVFTLFSKKKKDAHDLAQDSPLPPPSPPPPPPLRPFSGPSGLPRVALV